MLHKWDRINQLRQATIANLQENNEQDNEKNTQVCIQQDTITDEDMYKKLCIVSTKSNCPDCMLGSLVQNSSSGYTECDTCEYTDTIIITDDPEWRNHADSNVNQTRCGRAIDPLLPKSSMSTMINGNGFQGLKRVHQWNNMPYHERSLFNSFKQMDKLVNKSNILGAVRSDAKYYYKIIHDKDSNYVLTRGSIRKGVIAACYLYACNQRGIARTDLEVADIFKIDIKLMTKGCNKFREIMWKKGHKIYFDPISPLLYIERFGNICDISTEHIEIGKFISYRSAKLGVLSSNTPLSVSGGVLLLIITLYKYNITKDQIISICKTSDATIRQCFKSMMKQLTVLIPKKEYDKIDKKILYYHS